MKTECEISEDRPSGSRARSLLTKPLMFWLRLALGLIFILASVDKIIHPKAFAEIVHNYQVLPDQLVNLTAIILPWVEVFLGLLLILGIWLPGSVLVSNILLLIFFGTLVFNTARGINVHCGCFSTSASPGTPSPAWYIIRDSVFLLLGGSLLFFILPKKKSALSRAEGAGEETGGETPPDGG